jgi:hypothetical protein
MKVTFSLLDGRQAGEACGLLMLLWHVFAEVAQELDGYVVIAVASRFEYSGLHKQIGGQDWARDGGVR